MQALHKSVSQGVTPTNQLLVFVPEPSPCPAPVADIDADFVMSCHLADRVLGDGLRLHEAIEGPIVDGVGSGILVSLRCLDRWGDGDMLWQCKVAR